MVYETAKAGRMHMVASKGYSDPIDHINQGFMDPRKAISIPI